MDPKPRLARRLVLSVAFSPQVLAREDTCDDQVPRVHRGRQGMSNSTPSQPYDMKILKDGRLAVAIEYAGRTLESPDAQSPNA